MGVNSTHCGDYFTVDTNIKSLRCTSEATIPQLKQIIRKMKLKDKIQASIIFLHSTDIKSLSNHYKSF